jgi:hypothetical protein
MTYRCEFCNREFVRESTVAVHMCEPKRRRMSRGERAVQLGLQAYLRFYEIAQGSARTKTFEDFCDSPYYRAFVKWGNYCQSTRVINPTQFLEWLLRNNRKIDQWASDTMYNEYLVWYLQNESMEDALARAAEYSMDWAEKNTAAAHDCIRYGNANATCHAIVSGRVSAWVIYNSPSGQDFLSKLDPQQITMIWPYINSDYWQSKFQQYRSDQTYCEEVLKSTGW